MDTVKSICPHNEGIECDDPKCERCGWYPPVAKKRMQAVMGAEKKYKIAFTGYCEVWANSPEDAADKADNGDMFFAHYDFADPECLEKEEEDELD